MVSITIVPGASAVAKSTWLRSSSRWKAETSIAGTMRSPSAREAYIATSSGSGGGAGGLAATSASAGAGAATTAAGSGGDEATGPISAGRHPETISADDSSAAYGRGDMTRYPLQLNQIRRIARQASAMPPACLADRAGPAPCIAPQRVAGC